MAIQKNFLGNKPTELKRVEIYITNCRYNKLTKQALKDRRTAKNFIESIVNDAADNLKKEVADMMKGSYKAGLKESTITDNSYAELLKDRALVSQHNVDLIKDLKAQREQLARKDNKMRLLRKALTRMVAEFDTITPVIPNQKEAVRYANNLLQSLAKEITLEH